ncbi:MAG: hypothetical protein IT370_35980 [Deltaproteobacteria bacterium]|nr:hypothetical protein [Deltaproteobacteria bacterium]
MSFPPKCLELPTPRVYLLDRFVDKTEKPARFSDYPAQTREEFRDIVAGNLSLLKIKLAKGRESPLFKFETLDDLSRLPPFLNAGDIIMGFGVFPPYSVRLTTDIAFDGHVTPAGITESVDRIVTVSQKPFRDRWKTLKIEAQLRQPAETPEARNFGKSKFGVSPLEFKRNGKKVRTYLATRVGMVDAGAGAGEAAVARWDGTAKSTRDTLRAHLKRFKKAEFSVASVGETKDSTQRFERLVGAWLAYTFLHEFWHIAEIRSGHPYPDGTGIVGTPEFRKELFFSKEVKSAIESSYEDNWCRVHLGKGADGKVGAHARLDTIR